MDNCYICLEKTSIYYKFNSCNCYIYCHNDCFTKILLEEKCILCKTSISKNIELIEKNVEKVLLFRFIKIINDNIFLDEILKMRTPLYFLLFIVYSIIMSFVNIILSIFLIVIYYMYYLYYSIYNKTVYYSRNKIKD